MAHLAAKEFDRNASALELHASRPFACVIGVPAVAPTMHRVEGLALADGGSNVFS
jgi:hypothetical protein